MKRICLSIPCPNEAMTVSNVVDDLRRQLPEMEIHIYDSNSTGSTAEKALGAGARVVRESRQDKGSVVRSMFRPQDKTSRCIGSTTA